MSQADKMLARMRANPRADWSISNIEAVCRRSGLEFEAPRRGSHFTVRTPDRSGFVSVPSRRPIKPVYILAVVRLVDIMLGGRDDGE